MRLPSLLAGATRLVLVRHGEPEAASRGRCYGRTDYALSPRGVREAAAAARALASLPLAAVYASPLLRARTTAAPLADARGLPVRLHAGLAELDYGRLEAMPYDQIQRDHAELARRFFAAPFSVRFPDGEGFSELRARVMAAVDEVRAAHRDQAVALFAHAGPLRVVLAAALALPDDALFKLDVGFGGVTVIDLHAEGVQLRLANYLPPFVEPDDDDQTGASRS